MRNLVVVASALLCAACMQETVRFQPKPQQQSFVRDGQPALISQKANSIILIRPAARQFAAGGRPVFVVGVRNLTKTPVDFIVRNVEVTQVVGENTVPLKVFSYEELVGEERTRQVMTAVLVGAAEGLNAASASRAGYSNHTTTRYTPTGAHTTYTASYSSAAAISAQNRAFRENEKLTDTMIAQGQANLAILERDVMKDNTMMPGEWYGGTLHVQPPARGDSDRPRTYTIAMTVGADRHEIDILQESVR